MLSKFFKDGKTQYIMDLMDLMELLVFFLFIGGLCMIVFGLLMGLNVNKYSDVSIEPQILFKYEEVETDNGLDKILVEVEPLTLSCHEKACSVSVMHDCNLSDAVEGHMERGLQGLGDAFVDAYYQTGVCPYFLASICALESGWGDYPKGNNIAGLMRKGEYIKFDNKSDCIIYLAQLIKNRYSEDGEFYSGSTTIRGIAERYNTVSTEEWADIVSELMERIENNE